MRFHPIIVNSKTETKSNKRGTSREEKWGGRHLPGVEVRVVEGGRAVELAELLDLADELPQHRRPIHPPP
ncbi:hypothetical protein B296_00049018, partial [Ensete ventricosum]